MTNSDSDTTSCLRGLKRFDLSQDFNLWVLHFYNEMVEKDYHHYFPYNKKTKAYSEGVLAERKILL